MVAFIPSYLGEEIKSNAEIKMFEVLQGLNMEDAYVLHSLGLPRHQSKIYGEIDFVIVCRRGVACLEIKGGRVECRHGSWVFTDRYGKERKKREGPFAQVTGNMFSLRENLNKRFRNTALEKRIGMACGVVFPDIEFTSRTEEIIPEIVFDKTTEDITAYVQGIFDYWEERQHRTQGKLSGDMVKKIVKYLRGEFTFIPAFVDRLEQVEKRLIRLTAEQYQLMESLSQNERLLIQGNAGTGKTLLATDFAIKEAKKGKKVLYLTYNKNLSYSIGEQANAADNMKVINIHALFGEYVEVDVERMKADPSKYFEETLPEKFYRCISALEKDRLEELQYDLLVMDEGQDIVKPIYLQAMDRMLKNGLKSGHWAIFYDENQNIYNREYEEGMKLLAAYPATRFRLYVNCRNTVQIGTFSSEASGIVLKDYICERGEEVQKISYTDSFDYGKKITDILGRLKKEEVPVRDIVFLAPKRYKKTQLSQLGLDILEIGVDADEGQDVLRFSTIQGYKGLDSKVVILCEVDDIYPDDYAKLMYIATTRARVLLYIVGTEEFWRGVDKAIERF